MQKQFKLEDRDQLPPKIRDRAKQLLSGISEEEKKEKAKNNFLDFTKHIWPEFIEGEHHKIIADKFNKLATGEIKRLIVNMPPRHTKSEFASTLLPAWMIGREPKLKIMGVEAVKSSTPAPCREKIKQALKIIMNEDSKVLNSFIQDFRKEFMTLKPELVAYPRSVNGLNKWTESHNLFKKGAPIHCKGAILYNHLLKEKKLQGKYPYIQEGDKIKFLHMKTPNTYQSTSISFMTKLPEELNLHSIVDYDMQFEKSFIEPLKFITGIIQWQIDGSYGTQGTLEEFF